MPPSSTSAFAVSQAPAASLRQAATTSNPVAPSTVDCPEETHWDGLVCAHARATCGGWDGFSCAGADAATSAEERAAREEFAAIDDEARTMCPEDDESKQVYSGSAPDIVKMLDATFGRADKLRARLERLSAARQTPSWTVATSARIGSIYDCIWNSLRQTTPAYFTPQQQALLVKLGNVATSLNCLLQPCTANTIQPQIDNLRQTVIHKWEETREKYVAVLEARFVHSYVTAAVVARRYALEGYAFTRASRRLPIVAGILGDETMALIVDAMVDPTDPAGQRHLLFVAHAFDAAP